MKPAWTCFATGAAGTLSALVLAALGHAQYADYRARAESGGMLLQLAPLQQQIAARAMASKSFSGVGKGLNTALHDLSLPAALQVQDNGTLLAWGRHQQLIVLLPQFDAAGHVVWTCAGGSASDVPAACRTPATPNP
ncbi:hypothetical protein SAMN02745857_02784 [Andreprevotia lacus DSM 23236]|uniref:Pilin n=1 Tax=Andreprevotia lacus DSM 23236 TaxID=1121001 RepID=A0A1W1XUR7_9NEIS|nr:hypothetical protein [Andreprevotia lacus]SMC27281.1 hypothetical protein SAMN02745857_02784 [Andreprevotia lacus DSM 23236]